MSSTFSSSSLMLTGAAWPAAQPQMSKSPRGPSGPWRRCPPRSWCPPTCPRRQPAALTNIPPRRHHDSARLPCQRVDQQLRTPPGAQTLMREVASARIRTSSVRERPRARATANRLWSSRVACSLWYAAAKNVVGKRLDGSVNVWWPPAFISCKMTEINGYCTRLMAMHTRTQKSFSNN